MAPVPELCVSRRMRPANGEADDRGPQRRPGRPRKYDPAQALEAITAVFWRNGFAASSLDEIAATAGAMRPSLYGAFGNKESMYVAALEAFRERLRRVLAVDLETDQPLRPQLTSLFSSLASLYAPADEAPRGCLLIGAAVERVRSRDVQRLVTAWLTEIDERLGARLQSARSQHQLGVEVSPAILAWILGSLIHSVAVRARAGADLAELETSAHAALEFLVAQ